MTTTLRKKIYQELDNRDLDFGKIHSEGRDITSKDLEYLNNKVTDNILKLFTQEVEEMIGEDENVRFLSKISTERTRAKNQLRQELREKLKKWK